MTRIVLALLISLSASLARAETPLAPGDPFPPVTLEDQHGEQHMLGAGLRHVVFSRDMDAGKVAKAALEDEGGALLERAHAVYVSDIARMPGVITRMFALPGMRRRPYPMLLDYDGETTADWPSEPGRASLITLGESVIAAVEAFDDAEALRRALEASAAPMPVEQEIVRLEERRYSALVGADALTLDTLLDAQLVYTHSNGLVQGKPELMESLADGTLDYESVESQIEGLSIHGDVAVVSGRAAMGVTAAGREFDTLVRFTAVYARRDGFWRLVAYQSTSIDDS